MICSKHANVQNKLLVMQYIFACQYVKNLYLVATVFLSQGPACSSHVEFCL